MYQMSYQEAFIFLLPKKYTFPNVENMFLRSMFLHFNIQHLYLMDMLNNFIIHQFYARYTFKMCGYALISHHIKVMKGSYRATSQQSQPWNGNQIQLIALCIG